jgi:hypothetical protein
MKDLVINKESERQIRDAVGAENVVQVLDLQRSRVVQ